MSLRPLVLYSGGLDSTYLITLKINAKTPFDVLYVKGGQHYLKTAEELQMREKLLGWLNQQPDNPRVREYEVDLDWNNCLKVGGPAHVPLTQPQTWLFAAFRAFDPERHSSLQAGYVDGEGDGQEHMLSIWNGLCQLVYGKTFPLEFPLLRFPKTVVLDRISTNAFDYVWVCENPRRASGVTYRCGHCYICVRDVSGFHDAMGTFLTHADLLAAEPASAGYLEGPLTAAQMQQNRLPFDDLGMTYVRSFHTAVLLSKGLQPELLFPDFVRNENILIGEDTVFAPE